ATPPFSSAPPRRVCSRNRNFPTRRFYLLMRVSLRDSLRRYLSIAAYVGRRRRPVYFCSATPSRGFADKPLSSLRGNAPLLPRQKIVGWQFRPLKSPIGNPNGHVRFSRRLIGGPPLRPLALSCR